MGHVSSILSGGCSVTAVVVLYKRAPSESETLSTLTEILTANPALAEHLSLIIYDNSPHAQGYETSADCPIHYYHDVANGGLAAAYNYALAYAEDSSTEWLLVLDQDTSLTGEFFLELMARANTLRTQRELGAIIPKLLVQGRIHSPQMHFIDRLRHPFMDADPISVAQVSGVHKGRLAAYNSGAALRVSALREIGGFPREFWLDYLDHAVFHALCASGHSVYVMDAVLKHDCSHGDLKSIPLWRYQNTLAAESLHVKRTGNFADQLLYRIYLLRRTRSLWKFCEDRRIWKAAAFRALWLDATKDPVSYS